MRLTSKTLVAAGVLVAAFTLAAAAAPVSQAGHAIATHQTGILGQADSSATTVPPAVAPTAYVKEALDFIEVASFRLGTVDWRGIRAAAESSATAATSSADSYEIISGVLKSINDKHSSFTRPPQAQLQTLGAYNGFGFVAVWPSRTVVTTTAGAPAVKAGLRVGDRIVKIDGKEPVHNNTNIVVPRGRNGEFPSKIVVTISRKGVRGTKNLSMAVGAVTLVSVPTAAVVEPPKVGGVIGAFGYIDVPGIIGDPTAQKQYAQILQDAIRATDAAPRCGWIVDLRLNRGGYIYAMLSGLGPILGSGPVAGQLNAAGTRTMWTYADGTVFSGETPTVGVDQPYRVVNPDPAVAVLTSGLTASAGEAVTIAFRGRPNTRSFGEKTTGLTTFNVRKRMPDGAFLDILNAVDIDRAGNTYDGPVPPEQPVAIDWRNIGNQADPVLLAATRWLSEQTSCKQS